MCYFELRQIAGSANLAADITKHLQSRQHLGKTVVICDKPLSIMSMARKQWFKLARNLQKERASTINAEKILRLTNSITHMHRMSFIAKSPEAHPSAHAYFVTPEEAARLMLPVNTYSLYVAELVDRTVLSTLIEQLPTDAMIIDYTNAVTASRLPLQPKAALELQVAEEWASVSDFLDEHHIAIGQFGVRNSQVIDIVDDALDTLLGVSHRFLHVASSFQHCFELAQPFNFAPPEQRQYDVLMLLAHRVQALNPSSAFATRFTYNLAEDETFFLHDVSIEETNLADLLTGAVQRHKQAGRSRLARALAFVAH